MGGIIKTKGVCKGATIMKTHGILIMLKIKHEQMIVTIYGLEIEILRIVVNSSIRVGELEA